MAAVSAVNPMGNMNAAHYMGSTSTAAYLTTPTGRTDMPMTARAENSNGLPSVLSQATDPNPRMMNVNDYHPNPSPIRRSYTTLDFRPSASAGALNGPFMPSQPGLTGSSYSPYMVQTSSAPRLRAAGGGTSSITRSSPAPISAQLHLETMDPLRTPNVMAATRAALYTRYSPNEWQRVNSFNWLAADKLKSVGERLRSEASRMAREVEERTRRAQEESGKRLGERISDIEFWRSELSNETDAMNREMANMAEAKRCLEKAVAEAAVPLQIAQECLYEREKRQGIELVHDNVERSLLNEVDVVRRCQERMRSLLDRTNGQMAVDRATLHELENDSRDKFVALMADQSAASLRNSSRGVALFNGIERVDNTTTVPETWARLTESHILRSQAERSKSQELRADIAKALEECANDMWQAWNAVNSELTRRVQETTEARNRTQAHLSRVAQEIFDMEQNIEFLRRSMQEQENPLKVAQSRLEVRTHRPNYEATRDPAQHRLVEEVQQIFEGVDQLNARLRAAEATLQQLLVTKSTLEHDLAVKNNSIFLDREKCLGMRRAFPLAPRVVCY